MPLCDCMCEISLMQWWEHHGWGPESASGTNCGGSVSLNCLLISTSEAERLVPIVDHLASVSMGPADLSNSVPGGTQPC